MAYLDHAFSNNKAHGVWGGRRNEPESPLVRIWWLGYRPRVTLTLSYFTTYYYLLKLERNRAEKALIH